MGNGSKKINLIFRLPSHFGARQYLTKTNTMRPCTIEAWDNGADGNSDIMEQVTTMVKKETIM